MSRRKQSRPVKVLEDGSEEECISGIPRGEPGAAVVVNGHHVSTSTRRFDDGKYLQIKLYYSLNRNYTYVPCSKILFKSLLRGATVYVAYKVYR